VNDPWTKGDDVPTHTQKIIYKNKGKKNRSHSVMTPTEYDTLDLLYGPTQGLAKMVCLGKLSSGPSHRPIMHRLHTLFIKMKHCRSSNCIVV
jgi:hypothetical protein